MPISAASCRCRSAAAPSRPKWSPRHSCPIAISAKPDLVEDPIMTTKFTPDHEYIRVEGSTGIVGITPYAQEALGDIVFVELPAVGKILRKGDEAAVVESVKAASEIYAPVAGTVTEVNEELSGNPGLINSDPTATGWIYKIAINNPSELDDLLDDAAYADLT